MKNKTPQKPLYKRAQGIIQAKTNQMDQIRVSKKICNNYIYNTKD